MQILKPIEFEYSGIKKIISGGQCGSDQAGLAAAKDFGILTGGMAPLGYKTAIGNNPKLLRDFYGLIESDSSNYVPRTGWNVQNSDGTIRLATNFQSYGEIATMRFINRFKKPYFDVPLLTYDPPNSDKIISWLSDNQIYTLNVAGNVDRQPKDGFGCHYYAAYTIILEVLIKIRNR